jgi:hypothetical protein
VSVSSPGISVKGLEKTTRYSVAQLGFELNNFQTRSFWEIYGSYGIEYEDESLMVYNAV